MTLKELKQLPVDDQLIKDVKEYLANTPCYFPPAVRLEKQIKIMCSFLERSTDDILIQDPSKSAEDFIDHIYDTCIHVERHTPTIIATHKKGRSPKEKEKRSREDFIKNTLPKLDAPTQRHFKEKYKGKGYKGM